jgi:hypothetical protein
MSVNLEKSTLIAWGLNEQESQHLSQILNMPLKDLGSGLKYLGFFLKANNYMKNDWRWLIEKVEKSLLS